MDKLKELKIAFETPSAHHNNAENLKEVVDSVNSLFTEFLLGENKQRQKVEIVPTKAWLERNAPDGVPNTLEAMVKGYTENTVKELLEETGGILHFVDDERTRSSICIEPGVYVISETLRSIIIGLQKFDYTKAPIRHVFFDWYLGKHNDTSDLAFYLSTETGTLEECGIVLSENFTYSVHSSLSEAKDKIKEYIGNRKYATYKFKEQNGNN